MTRTSPPACPTCRGAGRIIVVGNKTPRKLRDIGGIGWVGRRCEACDGRGSLVVDTLGEYPHPCRTLAVEEAGCGWTGVWWSSRCTRCGEWRVRAGGPPGGCGCGP